MDFEEIGDYENDSLLPHNDGERSLGLHNDVTAQHLKDDNQDETTAVGYEDAVAATGYSWFHYRLLLLCGWALSSDAIEILSISFILPPASCQLQLTDADKGWLNSSIFLGMMVGGYLWGTLADLRGRRAVLFWSLSINGLGGLLSSFAQSYWLFLLLRIISGIGVGGSMPVVFTYFTEFQPKDRRGSMISILATFWMTGNVIAAGVAWLVIPSTDLDWTMSGDSFQYSSWQFYLAICTLPSLSSALLFVFMPESPKFLMQKGQNKAALKVFTRMYQANSRTRYLNFPVDHLKTEACNAHYRLSFANVFVQFYQSTSQLFYRPMLRISLVMLTIYFTLSFGFYGLWMWFPELFQRIEQSGGSPCSLPMLPPADNNKFSCTNVTSAIYFESFVTAAANLPGNILTILLIDRVGRKFLLSASMLLSAASVFLIVFLRTKTQSLVMSAFFSGVSVIGWNALDVLGAELFPTVLRSTAAGLLTGVGRVGAILGNLVFGQLVTVHCVIPMFMVATLLAIGSLSAILLPASTGIDLL